MATLIPKFIETHSVRLVSGQYWDYNKSDETPEYVLWAEQNGKLKITDIKNHNRTYAEGTDEFQQMLQKIRWKTPGRIISISEWP